MNASEGPAAPESGTFDMDPEIAALLDFEPVPRKRIVAGSWTPELQREFIARLAVTGSPGRACDEMGKNETGIMKLYRSPGGASFRAAWDAAVELAADRKLAEAMMPEPVIPGSRPPSLDNRRKYRKGAEGPLPGQRLNEYGEWEDGDSIDRRGDDATDHVRLKLLRCRRLFLKEISSSPGKCAAFEILTQLPIDWEKAKALEPQHDEPWRTSNQRQPDMILSAENGWTFVEGYGRKLDAEREAKLMKDVDAYRAKRGLPPVEWPFG